MIYLEIQQIYEFDKAQRIWTDLENDGLSVNYSLTEDCLCKLYIKPIDALKYLAIADISANQLLYYEYLLVFRDKDGNTSPLCTRPFRINQFILSPPGGNRYYLFPYILDPGYKGPLDRTTTIWWEFGCKGINDFKINISMNHSFESTCNRLKEMGFVPLTTYDSEELSEDDGMPWDQLNIYQVRFTP